MLWRHGEPSLLFRGNSVHHQTISLVGLRNGTELMIYVQLVSGNGVNVMVSVVTHKVMCWVLKTE